MGKKDKKKGKGAEKTAAKTEKKLCAKLKKELKALGEDDIESIVANIEKEETRRLKVVETILGPPSRRLNFTFIAHPDKEQLILFGGEFFNGQKTFIYNDLFFYNVANNTWTLVKSPSAPPPRCGHQMVGTSSNKGQLWLFGGEFASPTQSQFYHYRDLWLYRLVDKKWDKVTSPNGPSARSGHRMVYLKKHLVLFGGFHDNLREYKYFNDVYTFNTETFTWLKLEISGNSPLPRSGCCMIPLADGRILIYGGYSKEKLKKDVDKGRVFSDSFCLVPDKNDTTFTKWKWVQVKLTGISIPPRCSMPITVTSNNLFAYCFGGVFDTEEDEENLSGTFYNDFYCLDTERLSWKSVVIGKKEKAKSRRRKNKGDEGGDEGSDCDMEVDPQEATDSQSQIVADDGIFKVTVGSTLSNTDQTISSENEDRQRVFYPSPRMNSGIAITHGVLYLYGGMFEDGDKQITFNDFFSLDLKKLDEWKTIIEDENAAKDWIDSESSTSDEDDDVEEESNESDDSM